MDKRSRENKSLAQKIVCPRLWIHRFKLVSFIIA